ncbi:hypothetical protein [Prosthecobacter sp.]|uniref:hypothetical protein n=1 Tax=Prosthecobacter sp. TaxID=1965333 RepID=UPI00248799D0|nr:hypothetical protein [Prosthecobacter sp.]MDI1314225.1 hypothetical protein [Prosthecobacter sp.]
MKRALFLRLALGLILTSVLPSCGFAFRSAWKKGGYEVPSTAGDSAAPFKNSLPQSRWAGTWNSEATGHQGALRCVTSNAINGQGDHEFFYHATWMTILSGSYKAVHQVQKQRDGSYTFKGEHRMPNWAGGLYHYAGTIKGDEFKADYRCSLDNGTYTMKRVR